MKFIKNKKDPTNINSIYTEQKKERYIKFIHKLRIFHLNIVK